MHWLEVSLKVSGEAAEAVADVLTRFAPEGVALEASAIEHAPDHEGRPAGPVIVRAYLPAGDDLEDRRHQLEVALWHLGQLLPLPQPEYRPVSESDWADSWKASFTPVRAGRRLVIIPAWLYEAFTAAPEFDPRDIPLRMDPGMAFGTGTHPTTQLCLAAIERHLKPQASVLDLGTGSGILAIAAAKLGSGPVLGLDIDEAAVSVAQANVSANGVAQQVRVAHGSLAEWLAGRYGPARPAGLVVANILARVLVDLLGQGLAQTVAPDGWMILSGILESQAYQVNAALRQQGLQVLAQERQEEWVAIIAAPGR